ncbi:transposase [Streptomyces sp. NPDC056231]|uniref:transposase n=1 Tax=Streptomyces sp. NPDC056231 TaxID=3345755 RepID=UPI003AAC1198
MTTKLHLAADGRGRPLAILLTVGQRHDSVYAEPLLERIHVSRTGPGRPRCRPDHVIAYKAYSSRNFNRIAGASVQLGHSSPESATPPLVRRSAPTDGRPSAGAPCRSGLGQRSPRSMYSNTSSRSMK